MNNITTYKDKKVHAKIISYWIITILFVIQGLSAGILQILHVQHYVVLFTSLGYPEYFLLLLGIGKILGSIALAVPRYPLLREWAYAGFMFDFCSAIFSHLITGDGFTAILGPLFAIGFLAASYLLRPDELKLTFSPSLKRHAL